MTSEELEPKTGEESTEESAEQAEDAGATLNRAERRAQAKGKKAAPGGNNPAGIQNRAGGFNARASLGMNKTRIPRTGHK